MFVICMYITTDILSPVFRIFDIKSIAISSGRPAVLLLTYVNSLSDFL